MGEPDTFYRPDKWNPDGYFEQPDIHAINIPLINGLLWKFSYFWLPSRETILKRAARKSKLIHDTAMRYNGMIIKEARFCLTLPAWQKYGAKIEKIIVCLRDPHQVANSLKRRNNISLKRAYSLWLEHNLRLLGCVGNIPLWFINYADMVNQNHFETEIVTALRFFGIEAPKETLSKMSSSIITQNTSLNNAEPNYPEPVKNLWEILLTRHSKQFELG